MAKTNHHVRFGVIGFVQRERTVNPEKERKKKEANEGKLWKQFAY